MARSSKAELECDVRFLAVCRQVDAVVLASLVIQMDKGYVSSTTTAYEKS